VSGAPGGGERDKGDGEEYGETAGMSRGARIWIELGPYLGIGWVFVVSIGAFAALGWWLDRRFGTGATWLIVGSIFGIVVGFFNFFKVVLALGRREERGGRKS
jgi:hypothetical protein